MPVRIDLTSAETDRLIDLRAGRLPWSDVAELTGHSRHFVTDRVKRAVGGASALVVALPTGPAPIAAKDEAEDPNRLPYRAGHPLTWGMLTRGTCIEGERMVRETILGRRKEKRT